MIRTRTLLAALVAMLLLTPLAAAQVSPLTGSLPPSSLTLQIQPLDAAVGDEVQAAKVHGLYSVPVGVALSAIEVHFEIVSAPAWALASLSPAKVSVWVQPLAGGLTTTVPFATGLLVAAPDAPPGALGEIQIRAWTHGGGTAGPGETVEATIVRAAGGDDCHHAATDAPEEASASPEEASVSTEPTVVETQAASVAPVTGPVVGGLALLGAAGGGAYVLRRKAP